MKIIDISWPIQQEMTEYKNNKSVVIKSVKTMQEDGVRSAYVCLNNHTGTHVDAPAHFLPHGSSIDMIPLSALIGTCQVIDSMHLEEKITADDLATCTIKRNDIVLFKTRNSLKKTTDSFDYDFIYVTQSAAQYLAKCGVKAVGIDYLGIERNQPNHETHTTFMSNNIAIIEGLRLGHVDAGNYTLWCLPLALHGVDAAPARAVLLQG